MTHTPKTKRGLRAWTSALRDRVATLSQAYARDEGGNVLIMTAILTVPLALGAAVAVDTAELYRAKQNFQQAADAAVLVAANMYSDGASEAEAEEAGVRIFNDNLANLRLSKGVPKFEFPPNCDNGEITIDVAGQHPLFFPGLHGIGKGENGEGAEIKADAAASCPTTTFEVALVLDTSGSMNNTIAGDGGVKKIDTLRTEAGNLVDKVFALGSRVPRTDPVRFSVVPFSNMVAVDYESTKTGAHEAWSRAYEDRDGKSPIHHKDFDWASDTARNAVAQQGGGWKSNVTNEPLTRYTLFDDLNVKWRGCMQARPYPHSVEDTEPGTAGAASLFVPAFAPDEPDDLNGEDQWRDGTVAATYCTRFKRYYYRTWWGARRSYRACDRWSDGSRGQYNEGGNPRRPSYNDGTYYIQGVYQRPAPHERNGRSITGELDYRNNYIDDDVNMPTSHECGGKAAHEKCSGVANQHKRQAFTFKYKTDKAPDSSNRGPSFSCRSKKLLPLQRSKDTVKSYINSLQPSGWTNVPAGAAWGWRTLSSKKPYEGRRETARDNFKVMILMTDGDNTYYRNQDYGRAATPNETAYSGYGYGRHHDGLNTPNAGDGFMFDGTSIQNPNQELSSYNQAMNEHLLKVCENAKKASVRVYSIAFDVAPGSPIKDALSTCASKRSGSGTPYYFDATDSAGLANAFDEILKSLKRLRLTK